MKIAIISAMLGFFGALVEAQEPNTAAPALPAVQTPAAPVQPAVQAPPTPVQPPVQAPVAPPQPAVQAPAAPVQPATIQGLIKQQGQALAELKKKQEEGVKQIKESMKGKSALEIKKAVDEQKKINRAAVRTLKDAQKAELEQFKKDHPETVKKPGPAGKDEKKEVKKK